MGSAEVASSEGTELNLDSLPYISILLKSIINVSIDPTSDSDLQENEDTIFTPADKSDVQQPLSENADENMEWSDNSEKLGNYIV